MLSLGWEEAEGEEALMVGIEEVRSRRCRNAREVREGGIVVNIAP